MYSTVHRRRYGAAHASVLGAVEFIRPRMGVPDLSLELLSTLASVLTVLIVGATAIAALAQLRHMRAGNQINAILAIGDKFTESRFEQARSLVNSRTAEAMNDPQFRAFVIARGQRKPLPVIAAEMRAILDATNLTGNLFEEIGNLVKNGIVDETLILDVYCTQVVGMWGRLESYIALSRDASNDIGLWDNFEYLTVRARAFLAAHPTTYPKGVPRIQLTNPWHDELKT